MKIYILRHEQRPANDPGFLTELTAYGKHRAMFSLKNTLDNASIDHIYSSPFLRTLQTVAPFVGNNYCVNIEYGLAEGLCDTVFENQSDFQLDVPPCRVNDDYKSVIDRNNYRYPESNHLMRQRPRVFCDKLLEDYKNSHDNILLVTHKCVCNALLERITGSPRHLDASFNMGQLACVENGEIQWVN